MSLNRNQYYHTFYTVDSSNPTRLTQTVYDNSGTQVQQVDMSFGTTNAIDVLKLLDTNSNQPFTLGLVDTSNTAVSMGLAYMNVFPKALTATQKSKLIPYINTNYKEPRSVATNTYTVTVSGGKYYISTNGGESVQQPFLLLQSGGLYVFDQSDATNTGNTLVLGTTNDLASTIVGNNVVYNGTAGSANAYTLVDLSGANAPTPLLFYFSNLTSGMGPTRTVITYTVTVSGDVYYMATGGGERLQAPSIEFQTDGIYVFDQSSSTNRGNTLVLGTTNEQTNSVVGNNVVYNGTAGSANAYTLIDFGGTNPATTSLYYFSASRFGLSTTRPYTYYTVTVSGGVFYFSNQSQPYIRFTSGNLYVFDQSHSTNTGNTLVLGTLTDMSSTIVSTNVVYDGSPGITKAYTLIDFSGAATTTMYYFSQSRSGMGTPTTTYVVTVSGGTYYLATGGTTTQQPTITFSLNRVYIFDQTGNTNVGNQLVLGTKREGLGSSVTNNVLTYGTAGTTGAYTVIDFGLPNPAATSPLFYYSSSTVGLGSATNKYVVTVSGGMYYLANGGTNLAQRIITFTTGGLYYFDQSEVTNAGNRLILGTTPEIINTKVTANVVSIGTPGTAGAYTLIQADTTPLYYFSESNVGLGTTPTKYIVTVSGGVYYLNEAGPTPQITYTIGSLYLFDQSNSSNTGNQLVLGLDTDVSSSIVTTNVTYNLTPGSAGAYTLIRADTALLYYFSRTTVNMGYFPKYVSYTANVNNPDLRISIPTQPGLICTLEFWAYKDSTARTSEIMFCGNGSGANKFFVLAYPYGNRESYFVTVNELICYTRGLTFDTGPGNLGQGWHHFAVVINKYNTINFYVNGTLLMPLNGSTNPASTLNNTNTFTNLNFLSNGFRVLGSSGSTDFNQIKLKMSNFRITLAAVYPPIYTDTGAVNTNIPGLQNAINNKSYSIANVFSPTWLYPSSSLVCCYLNTISNGNLIATNTTGTTPSVSYTANQVILSSERQ